MHSSAFVLVAIFSCAYAQVSMPPGYKEKYPNYYKLSKQARHPRDVTWEEKVGSDGKVFGTLGGNDQGLFGTGGYKQEIFNDDRGKLAGQAYGTRVLGAGGDSTMFGGKLDWSNSNKDAKIALDLNKELGSGTKWSASGDKVWNFDKNTRLSTGGFATQVLGRGRPDYGVGAKFEADW